MVNVDWKSVRKDFPILERYVYLNSAATGPLSPLARKAVDAYYNALQQGADERWEGWIARREAVRNKVARLINALPEEVAFVSSTSDGMNKISDLLIDEGEVVTDTLEFPSSTLPWLYRGAKVKWLEPVGGTVEPERIKDAISRHTGIIVTSYVQHSNGFRQDLEALGSIKGRSRLVVNATQAAGVFPIDVKKMKIDCLVAVGHKWLLSGYGIGFLYISKELLRKKPPRELGWLSVKNPHLQQNDRYEILETAARYELGSPNLAGIFALGGSIDYINSLGLENIMRRNLGLNKYLVNKLKPCGYEILSPAEENYRSAHTLIKLSNPAKVQKRLAEGGISIAAKPQGIRIACHFFNNDGDIDKVVGALEGLKLKAT